MMLQLPQPQHHHTGSSAAGVAAPARSSPGVSSCGGGARLSVRHQHDRQPHPQQQQQLLPLQATTLLSGQRLPAPACTAPGGDTPAPAAATPLQAAAAIHGPLPQYGGRCTLCGDAHWLPCTPEAVGAMRELLATIDRHQRLDCFDATQPPDPRYHLRYLFTAGPGRMLGVLLARDAAGCTHTLRAFSGQITESWHIPGWAGPVAGIINTSPAYVRTRAVIERISDRMRQLEQQQLQQHSQQQQPQQQQAGFAAKQRQLLKRRRRALSHALLQQIQQSYLTTPAGMAAGGQQQQQQQLSLLDVWLTYRQQHEPGLPVTRAGQGFVGMPAGAGDCCAPKLLHAAARQGLTPVALCEVWFGSAPGTATPAKQGRAGPVVDPSSSRQHCRLYGPCDKCSALLGTMLHSCVTV